MNNRINETAHCSNYDRLWPLMVLVIAGPLGLSDHRARCQVAWKQSFASIEDDVGDGDLLEISRRLSVAFGFHVPSPMLAQCVGHWFTEVFVATLRTNDVRADSAFVTLAGQVTPDATAPLELSDSTKKSTLHS